MKLGAVLVLVVASSAHASATFDEYSDAVRQQPAAQLYEASCDIAIELRGALATIDTRMRIVNPGPDAMAAFFELPLPRGGQVTRFASRGERGIAVPAHAPSVEGASPVLGVDPAWLARPSSDEHYRIVLQPIEPDHEVIVETTVVALAEPRGGFLRLVLPARAASKLTACRGHVRALPGPGAVVKKIRIAGADTAGARATFALDAKDLAIAVELDVAGTQPVVWTQTQALADGWHATLVTAVAPRVKASGARRVVFLVDASRSMDLVGRHNIKRVIRGSAPRCRRMPSSTRSSTTARRRAYSARSVRRRRRTSPRSPTRSTSAPRATAATSSPRSRRRRM
jgi:hypothetical protein